MTSLSTGKPKKLRKLLEPFEDFFSSETAGSTLLLAAAVLALVWANTPLAHLHQAVFGARLGPFTVAELISDGLMPFFFLLVGLEIKRELVTGELNTRSKALLPLLGALGGMVIPAGIFLCFNHRGEGAHGWGIPMATDIAFSLAVIKALEGKVPHALAVFLTALAIFDDLGGILVIAFFYGTGVHPLPLGAAALLCAVLGVLNRFQIRSLGAYLIVGAGLAVALHHAGIHVTIAGVIVGLFVPARGEDAPLPRFEHRLHPWSTFLIVPLFALASSAIPLLELGGHGLFSPVGLGVALGLFLGKPLGITAVSFLAVKSGLATLPTGASFRQLHAIATVAGIGFTVALFVASLAFSDARLLADAKLGILVGSVASAVVGYVLLAVPRSPVARSVR